MKSIGKVISFAINPLGTIIGGSLFGGGKKKAAAMEKAEPVMPIPDQAAVTAAKKQELIRRQARGSGRASTILSDNSETLGA